MCLILATHKSYVRSIEYSVLTRVKWVLECETAWEPYSPQNTTVYNKFCTVPYDEIVDDVSILMLYLSCALVKYDKFLLLPWRLKFMLFVTKFKNITNIYYIYLSLTTLYSHILKYTQVMLAFQSIFRNQNMKDGLNAK